MSKKFIILGMLALLPSMALVSQLIWPIDHVVLAPDYAEELLQTTEVRWIQEKGQIGGEYRIARSGDPDHRFVIILSVQSNKGNQFISANSQPGKINFVKHGGWSDLERDVRDRIDWPTAKVRVDMRIYDGNNTVLYHGVKSSPVLGKLP